MLPVAIAKNQSAYQAIGKEWYGAQFFHSSVTLILLYRPSQKVVSKVKDVPEVHILCCYFLMNGNCRIVYSSTLETTYCHGRGLYNIIIKYYLSTICAAGAASWGSWGC